MTGRYVLSPRARGDLDEIRDYSAERWGEQQAESYIRAIQTAIDAVASAPRAGESCDKVRPGYFKYGAGSHVIFFRLTKMGIDVVRILHQRMDFNRHL